MSAILDPMNKQILLGTIGAIGFSLLLAAPVLAQGVRVPQSEVEGTPITLSDIVLTVRTVVNYLLIMSGLVVTGFIVWAGILIATAHESENQRKKGMDTLKNAIIGAIIIFGVGVIANTIASFAQAPTEILR
jgi:cytochrome bd-type quinol oxidase subunit 2